MLVIMFLQYFNFDFMLRCCLLCKAENQLQLYESMLFSVFNQKKNILVDESEEKDEITVYESSCKGFWKISQKEFLLMS